MKFLYYVTLITLLAPHITNPTPTFKQQEERVKKLLDLAVKTLQKKNIGEACSLFSYDKKWNINPYYLLFINPEHGGLKLVDQLRPDAVWAPTLIHYDFMNRPLMETMLTALEPQWIDYWRFDKLFHARIKIVEKEKIKYVLAVGFFPDTKEFLGQTLLNTTLENIKTSSVIDVSNIINNIHGRLIVGDVFATIIDTSGLCWAHGKNYLLVGQNLLQSDRKDVYQTIVKQINEKHKQQGSFDYKKNGAINKIFYALHHDTKENRDFVIITEYCSNVTQETTVFMAQKVANLLKNGNDKTIDHINLSQSTRDQLASHELTALIIDKKSGKVLAGTEPQFFAQFGRNFFDYYDQKQQPIGQILRELAQQNDSGYFSRFERNALERVYFLNVETSFGAFTILISNYYPYSKKELAPILAEDALRYLVRKQSFDAFDYMGEELSPFLIGDVSLKIYDTEGFQWLNGTSYETMWSYDKTLSQAPEGWIADQRNYPVEVKYFRKMLPHFLQQPETLIIGASYSEIIQ